MVNITGEKLFRRVDIWYYCCYERVPGKEKKRVISLIELAMHCRTYTYQNNKFIKSIKTMHLQQNGILFRQTFLYQQLTFSTSVTILYSKMIFFHRFFLSSKYDWEVKFMVRALLLFSACLYFYVVVWFVTQFTVNKNTFSITAFLHYFIFFLSVGLFSFRFLSNYFLFVDTYKNNRRQLVTLNFHP